VLRNTLCCAVLWRLFELLPYVCLNAMLVPVLKIEICWDAVIGSSWSNQSAVTLFTAVLLQCPCLAV
jgi:hypothetical protein